MKDADFKPAQAARAWAAKHPLMVIGVLLFLCLGPFINKAVHIDDPLFVWSAEWILKHPGDFYGFDVNWTGVTLPMAIENWNPPATSYLLAGAAWVFGGREIVLHGAFMLVAFAACAGIYHLARLWCERPLLATVIAMITPVFLVSSTTLMCDVPMLALWVWAVVLWERALTGGDVRWFLAAGVLAGLAVLTKYSALTFLPLLLVLGVLRKRRPGWWLLWLAVPVAMIEAYQFGTAKLYGQGLISAAADYSTASRLTFEGGWQVKWISVLAFAGGCLLPASFFAPLLWRRRPLLMGSLLVFGLSLGALSCFRKLGEVDLSGGDNSQWGFLLQMSLLMAGGLHLLLLAAVELWRRRDTVAVVLAAWIYGGFIFAAALNWTVSARSMLPIVPPVAILLMRRLGRENPGAMEGSRWLWPLIPPAIFSLFLATADFELANSGRAAARQIMTQYRSAISRLRFEGHCGFQYYMEKLGAQPVDYELTTLQPGDILVVPSNNSNITWPASADVEVLEMVEFDVCSWLSTVQIYKGAGFYGAGGTLPFVIGTVSPERYSVCKVLQPLQFHTALTILGWRAAPSDVQAIRAGYESVLRANPNDATAHAYLASLLDNRGEAAEAVRHYREALRLTPDEPCLLNNLAWLLATCPDARIRDGAQAVKHAERACALTRYKQTMMVGTLAAAYAEAGRFDDAIATAQKACAVAFLPIEQDLLKKNQELLELYRKHQPYRDDTKTSAPPAQ